MAGAKLKAPFIYFGGKSRVADLVWERLGDVDNFIEGFCGSAAVLLARPHRPRIETANDYDCMIANFWRATQHDPEAVASYADYPVQEACLHARHRWLVLSPAAADFREKMRTDPDYYDPKVAGWWCWGACCWIGSGWCSERGAEVAQLPRMTNDVRLISGGHLSQQLPRLNSHDRGGVGVCADTTPLPEKRPQLHTGNSEHGRGVHAKARLSQKIPDLRGDSGAFGRGVNASAEPRKYRESLSQQLPRLTTAGGQGVDSLTDSLRAGNRPQLADAFSRGRGVNGNDQAETCRERREWLIDWFGRLRDRLRTVRVCCGDWKRVCDSPSVTTRLGLTGIFLDPPYAKTKADGTENRTAELYGNDATQDVDKLVADVRAYCLERGPDPMMRICLAGYAGEGHEILEQHGWKVVEWKASGGYGNRTEKGKENAARERLWFSPHCIDPEAEEAMPLFSGAGQAG